MKKIQLAVHQVNNVIKSGNDLDASVILKKAAKEAGKVNAISGPTGEIIHVKFNKDNSIKKGYRNLVKTWMHRQRELAKMFNVPCKFNYISINIG